MATMKTGFIAFLGYLETYYIHYNNLSLVAMKGQVMLRRLTDLS